MQAVQIFARVAHREDHDAARRILFLERRENLDARTPLHVEIQDRQIGFRAVHEFDRLLARARFAHDVDPGLKIKQLAHAAAKERMIVDDRNRMAFLGKHVMPLSLIEKAFSDCTAGTRDVDGRRP